MLYALAMLLDRPASEILEQLEYKGDGERTWHVQEFMDLLFPEGLSLIIVEQNPSCFEKIDGSESCVYTDVGDRLTRYMRNATGIILQERGTEFHALAWDGVSTYDPHGQITIGAPNNIYAFLRLVKL